MKTLPGRNGGRLSRTGRKKGAVNAISRTFQEFAQATLDDPDVQRAIRKRLMDEIAGKKRNPMPALTVLAAAAVKEKPVARGASSVVFIAQITNGRGDVKRLELASDEARALPPAEGSVEVHALPSAVGGTIPS